MFENNFYFWIAWAFRYVPFFWWGWLFSLASLFQVFPYLLFTLFLSFRFILCDLHPLLFFSFGREFLGPAPWSLVEVSSFIWYFFWRKWLTSLLSFPFTGHINNLVIFLAAGHFWTRTSFSIYLYVYCFGLCNTVCYPLSQSTVKFLCRNHFIGSNFNLNLILEESNRILHSGNGIIHYTYNNQWGFDSRLYTIQFLYFSSCLSHNIIIFLEMVCFIQIQFVNFLKFDAFKGNLELRPTAWGLFYMPYVVLSCLFPCLLVMFKYCLRNVFSFTNF